MNKTIPVTLPDWVWGRLVNIADDRGIPVSGLIADTIRRVLDDNPRVRPPKSRLEQLNDEVLEARKNGYRAPVRGGHAA